VAGLAFGNSPWGTARRLAVLTGTIAALAGCTATTAPAPEPVPVSSEPRAAADSVTPGPLPVVASTSSGCAATTDATLAPGSTTTRTVTVEGADRTYLVHVPTGYDPATPAPSVVTLHGMGTNAFLHLANTGIIASADANGYVVVAPEGQSGMWKLPSGEGPEGADTPDLDYLDAVNDDVDAALCLNPARRYATGMSMGSAMTLVLACQPDRAYAAFGGVGASFYRPVCDAAPPAPLIYFHGTADEVVPFEGGKARGFEVEPAPTSMADWADHNGCRDEAVTTRLADVERVRWSGCSLGADVDFYRIDGGGHTWPGSPITTNPPFEGIGGVTTRTVSATDAMWDFFTRYELPSQP
jgi:polyhydroxybutyrate depolymerase